ncbi:hypothetical protein L332_03470 [Agrococcus pavilionensis RW1]|uniref:Phage replisome organiser N-terminal domain-containing protein n=1 Tax=Agrococcus pavilionensis RW1 TaxID=1330458 RepID=U1LMB8_9MICO|nr:hypothetical protein [Agrococcus pavilionensis]ERG63469.1 hypothetical protein L332_03470 [Agrococcus pavilionensis RW1]
MRIRSTKPEFWRSERIASVDWDARLVLKGLESYVDDNGVGKDDVVMIVSDVFPRDLAREPSRTLARVSEAISALAEAGLVHRYEADGDRLLYMAFWEQAQRIDRPAKGRLPRPDGTFEYGDSEIRESVANPREPSRALATGTGEQGIRDQGSGDQSSSSAEPTRPDVERLLDLLDAEIAANGGRVPSRTKKNRDAMRLLLDRDGRSEEQVAAAIRWAQGSEFWRANILSAVKLREKYETLRLQAQRERGPGVSRGMQAAQLARELEAEEQMGRRQIGA